MARWNELSWREDVYKAAEDWRDRCFFKDAALFNDKAIWTEPNLREVQRRIIHNADYSAKDFWDKLRLQLEGGDDDNYQLVAEIMWLIYLFPLGQKLEGVSISVKAETKIRRINQILSWGGLPDANGQVISHPALSGIGRVGRRYKHYFYAIEFLLDVTIAWKLLPTDTQQELIKSDNAWQFSLWCDDFLQEKQVPMRHALLFFLYTDKFERMVSSSDKKQVLRDLIYLCSKRQTLMFLNNGGFDSLVAIDKAIFELRQTLQQYHNRTNIDFYRSPIDGTWGKIGARSFSSNIKLQEYVNSSDDFSLEATENEVGGGHVKVETNIDAFRFEELEQKGHAKQTEGERKLVSHYVRERSPKLRIGKLQKVIKEHGHLKCECCGTNGDTY
ncbi:hypothetical protein, partial [Candidatus Puniceispirillum sp.]|uniref:hypothetical protein n=1 Tax=Candidatus Puniceispirillum sp. TaxID=2026719 RepID=UPI003F69C24A